MADSKTYFASLPPSECAGELTTRIQAYYDHLRTSGYLERWRRSYKTYYRQAINNGALTKSGEQSEYVNMNVNHYHNLLSHIETMTTSQRPAFEPRATNTDYESQAQTILATGLLDYYMREKKMETYIKQAVEYALIFAEGFVSLEWDQSLGRDFGVNPTTGSPVKDGDVALENKTPLDVIRDFTKESHMNHDWYIVRSFKNKWTLAAQFPELQDRILSVADKTEQYHEFRLTKTMYSESDDIALYTFYHKKTAALPEGRILTLVGDDVVLLDGPIPYDSIPVHRISVGELIGTPFGHSVAYDLIPIQLALDVLYSTVLTNQSTFGVQNILIPDGCNLTVDSLQGGMNALKYSGKNEPKALNLTSTPPEIFNFMLQLEKEMELVSGVNSVARGNPESSLKSGTALALVQSMAIQFNSGLQQSYASLLEDLGTGLIQILKAFAKTPRVAAIAGKANKSLMKEFKGDDLNLVNRVTVDFGNPLTKTTAGRIQIAETLLENKLIKTAEQYLMVLETGKLEPLIEGVMAELTLIRDENENLASGDRKVMAIATDDHNQHIREHKIVLASTDARMDPAMVERVLAHLQEHINLLSTVDPNLLAALGQQGIAPAAPPGAPTMNASAGQVLDATNPITQEAATVNMPNQPKNPLTGQPNQ